MNPDNDDELLHSKGEEADQTWGQKVAAGHAWDDHRHQFDVSDREDFADLIDGFISSPSDRKALRGGRRAYWDHREEAVVIINPEDPDGGTIFKPDEGKSYFDNLL